MTDTFAAYGTSANAAKPKLALFKKESPKPEPPQAESKPAKVKPEKIKIWPAPDGAPVDPELPEQHRKCLHVKDKVLQPMHVATLNRVIERAGDGDPKTLGLRLILAAASDEHAAAWPVGMLVLALHIAGDAVRASQVNKALRGVRLSRFRAMAEEALKRIDSKNTTA